MKRWVALLASGLCVGTWFSAHASPAVLLKAYPVDVIRGKYLLGRRMAFSGEKVKIDSLDGPKAKVLTLDGDVLTVYCADLQLLPEVAPVAVQGQSKVQPSPTPVPSPTPAPALSLIPDIFGPPPPDSTPAVDKPATTKTKKVAKANEGSGARREVAVQCSGTTKKGTHCTRMTRSPNGLCWQHGGD